MMCAQRPTTSRGRQRSDAFAGVELSDPSGSQAETYEVHSRNDDDEISRPRTSRGRRSHQLDQDSQLSGSQVDRDFNPSEPIDVLTLGRKRPKSRLLGESSSRRQSSGNADIVQHVEQSSSFSLVRSQSSGCQTPDRRRSSLTDGGVQTSLSRPGSSRYKVLPPISTPNNDQLSTAVVVMDKPSETQTKKLSKKTEAKSNDFSGASRHVVNPSLPSPQRPSKSTDASSTKTQQVPTEHSADEDRVLIAVKLPSGERLQRNFRPTDQLLMVLRFVEAEAKRDYKASEFVRADTRELLSDMTLTIKSAGVADRSVLFLQLPEPEIS